MNKERKQYDDEFKKRAVRLSHDLVELYNQ
jgi:transposase-like protein